MKTAQEIAEFVGGTLRGDGATEIRRIASLDRGGPDTLAYAEGRYVDRVDASHASCVLVPPGEYPNLTVIVVDQPRVAFARVAEWLTPSSRPFDGVHDTAIVSPKATLDPEVAVGAWVFVDDGATIGARSVIFPGCFVGRDCHIGEDCIVYPRVVLYPGVEVGDRSILHAGTVLGADGFGFVFDGSAHVKIPQVGRVVIGDDVEVGANACVDRGALDETVVHSGAKIDNLCQIAHNVHIGEHAVISSQTGIAGSSRIGDHATIGGQVGIADYCRIDDRAIVGAQCGVPSRKRVPAGEVYWGTPARPLKNIKQQQAHLGRLPRLAEEVRELRAEVDALKQALAAQRP